MWAGGLCRQVPAWSPDGRRVAFECSDLSVGGRNPYLGHICVMNANGSNSHRLPHESEQAADTAPSWSPDGKRIAVQRVAVNDRGDAIGDGVYVLDADGANARRISPAELRGAQPDWSPDGRRILFYSDWDGPEGVSANIYAVGVDGTALRQLTHASGGRVQHLSATFSPDGKWIAFGKKPGTGSGANADIFVMRASGKSVRNVTRSAIWDSGVDWGPRR